MSRFLSICAFAVLLTSLLVAQQPAGQGDAAVTSAGSGVIDSNDPLLKPPPLPAGSPSLIGGLVMKKDAVKNVLVIKPFGGSNMKIFFDERTHIYRNGTETTQLGIRKGDRVYVDTLLDGSRVFAKNIHVRTVTAAADARGQLLRFDPEQKRIEMRDELSSESVRFGLDDKTVIRREGQAASVTSLLPGSLIGVHFMPESPGSGIAREITVYAAPGQRFTFTGKITHLDMKAGLMAVENQDNRNYELHFEPAGGRYEALGVGSMVTATAVFDGKQYNVQSIGKEE